MPRKRTATTFVSKADTKEMRDYQATASHYPPLPKAKLVEVSRRFIEGRRASVTLMENAVLDGLLGGDWEGGGDRDTVIAAFRERVEAEYEDGRMPKDVHDVVTADILQMEDSYDLFLATRNLDRAAQRRLARLEEAGNEALEKMVNHNLQFAMACVGKMMRRNRRAKLIGAKELIAVANVGLVLGARQYDPDSDKAFTTYAAYHINGQLYDYLNREDGNMGIKAATLHEQKQIIAIRLISESFRERYGRSPSVREISSLTHISPDRVVSRMEMPAIKTQSIFSRGKGEEGDDQEVFLPDLGQHDDNGIEAEWASRDRDEAMLSGIDGVDALPWPQGAIIRMHIGIGDDGQERKSMTTKQIARELKMTVHSVERELNEGLRSLRDSIGDIASPDYMMLGDDYHFPEADGDGWAEQPPAADAVDGEADAGGAGDAQEGGGGAGGFWADDDIELDEDALAGIDAAGERVAIGGWMSDEAAARMRGTLSELDRDGYDQLGYDAEGYNRLGLDRRGVARGGGDSIASMLAPYGDDGTYMFVRALFDAGQSSLPGVLEAMRLAGVDHPDVLLADDGEMTITGGGVRIVRAATGIITFRRDAPGA